MPGIDITPWQQGLTPEQHAGAVELLREARQADRRAADAPPVATDQVAIASVDGVLAGLAWYRGSDPAELFVHPAYRGRGVGTRLADTVFEAGRGVWAHGTLPAARAIAQARQAAAVRELKQLRRPLRDLAEVTLPEGVSIRSFVPGQDDARFLEVNARAFAWHPEQGRLAQVGLEEEMTQPWFDAAGFFLAVPSDDQAGGGIFGFHWTKIHPHDPTPSGDAAAPEDPIGEVYVIAVDPGSPIRHLGAPLTLAGLNYLTAKGLQTVMLYVESDNEPALRLYEQLGFSDYATDTVFATAD